MATSEKKWYSWVTQWVLKTGLLDKKNLEFDAHKIQAFYHNNGFIKARVGEPQVVFEDGG